MIFVYQNYITGQTEFVLNYDYNVSQTLIVRLIDAFVDSIPQEVLVEENVATTGRPSSHPAILLKILLFAYSRKTYYGRQIESMLEEHLIIRWMARDHTYIYHTINNFRRSNQAINLIKLLFVYFSVALTELIMTQNDADFNYVNKIEVDDNKYSFTWCRAVEKYHDRLI